MRKIGVICIAIIFAASNVFAQESQNKKEKKDFSEMFPQTGDFAVGLDMANFVQSIFGSITGGTNNPTLAFQSDFYGKYFLTDKSALRVRLGIGINNSTDRRFVRNDAEYLLNPLENNPITEAKTVDVRKNRNTGIELGVGYEYRRSLWRVQGYVGGEVFGGMGIGRNLYEYGNPMTNTNQTPTTTGVWGNTNPYGTRSYRLLDEKTFSFNAGAAAFIGADLFICRNLSIGAEFRLEGRYTRWNERKGKTETWLFDQAYTAEEKTQPVTSNFGLNPGWGLNLMIYF